MESHLVSFANSRHDFSSQGTDDVFFCFVDFFGLRELVEVGLILLLTRNDVYVELVHALGFAWLILCIFWSNGIIFVCTVTM